MDLLIGTGNAGKLHEYEELLSGLPVRLLGLKDVGLGDMEVAEDATTLEENASLKVQAYSQASGLITLADDTGLFVDALGGEPGVYPARYGGPGLSAQQRRQKLLAALDGRVEAERSARFICVIALANPRTGRTETVRGVCEGRIALAESDGGSGFGYDAVFIPQGYDITWAHVPLAAKNAISHRGQAARLIIPIVQRLIEG
ncbi:MAG: non-canonical purine NTP pyrophosphatase [Anaerolineae bacterium]|nr:non-canonical purine NTP pyrophosphatase [Anaerolineae bacterium]